MYVIVGASSGVGRAIAETFAAKGCDLVLVSRELRDTNAVASDLSLRFGVKVVALRLDVASPAPDFTELTTMVELAGEGFKGLLIPAGAVIDTDTLAIDAGAIDGLFRVNCSSICQLIVEVLAKARTNAELSVVGFGSIASIRGRGSNMIYSAAKAAIKLYFESLRHANAGKDIVVQYYVLGYMDTNLAFAYNVPLPKGAPAELAAKVYRNIHKDFGVSYFPRYWMIIAIILKLVPWAIYKRLRF